MFWWVAFLLKNL